MGKQLSLQVTAQELHAERKKKKPSIKQSNQTSKSKSVYTIWILQKNTIQSNESGITVKAYMYITEIKHEF